MSAFLRMLRDVSLAWAFAACAVGPAVKPVVAPGPEPAQMKPSSPAVEKLREYLEVTPFELIFSGLRGKTQSSESVSLKNTGPTPMQIVNLHIVGPEADSFAVTGAPGLPFVLAPMASLSFMLNFAAPVDSQPGVHRARLRILRPFDDDGPPIDLSALVTAGTLPEQEPTLQQILETLGYAVEVGSKERILFSPKLGEEVISPRFQRAKTANVGLYLIARYSAAMDTVFGTYAIAKGKPKLNHLGGSTKAHHQTLNPELSGESQTNFDPGDALFGLFVKNGKNTVYSEAERNTGQVRHRVRCYPLQSRGRTLVPDAYVAAFDDDGDQDYQDHVFLLWNVKPVP